MRFTKTLAVVAALILPACGDDEETADTGATTPDTGAVTTPTGSPTTPTGTTGTTQTATTTAPNGS